MVIFTLHSENATEVKYEYYPEGKKDNKPGIIIIDIIKMQIKEIIPAENDFYVKHTAAEINELRDAANRMRIEEGRPEITEEEWPSAKDDIEYYKYAQHAIEKIDEMYESKGKFLSEGMAAWY